MIIHKMRTSKPFSRWALMIALLGTTCAACRGLHPLPDILLITVDTLRVDHLSLYGYGLPTSPQLDQRFRRGVVFERAYATETSTPPSVASILTGLLPQQHRVRLFYQLLGPDVPTLPELLPESYVSAAFVSNTVLTDDAMGLAGRFDHYDDFVDEKEPYRLVYERNARRTTDAVLAWLNAHADAARPLFLWVHYIDPHGPYHPPKYWKRSFEHLGTHTIKIDKVPYYQREPGVTDGLAYIDAYDEEIAYTDSEIGRLLDGYGRRRSLESALVIFTADHGESMMEHERWFTHGYHVYEEISRVPLMILAPGLKPVRREEAVSTLDIVPTILTFIGIPSLPSMMGIDLLSGAKADVDRTVFTEATAELQAVVQRRAAVRGQSKWIAEISARSGKVERSYYYDLRTDPLELNRRPWPESNAKLLELISADPDAAGVPAQYARGIQLRAPKVSPNLSRDALERLKALGYVD